MVVRAILIGWENMGWDLSYRNRPLLLLALSAGVLFLNSCSWNKKEKDLDPGEVVRVQVPVYSENKYSLQIVELKTLRSLTNFSGTSAQFLMDAKPNDRLQVNGRTPHFRYIRDSEGVVIPLDDESLQMVTTYAHYEHLHELDQQAGMQGVLTYPRKVVVATQIKNSEGTVENNAVYSSKFDSLLMAPYSEEALPLMVNAGVIGHEHFHSLFYQLVIKPLGDKYPSPDMPTLHPSAWDLELFSLGRVTRNTLSPREEYLGTFLRAVNEGLADLWGWVFSGDNNFVGRSLPLQKLTRDLSISAVEGDGKLYPKNVILNQIQQGASRLTLEAYAYLHGVQLARALRNHIILDARHRQLPEATVKLQFTKVLKEALVELQKTVANLGDTETPSLSQALAIILQKDSQMSSGACSSTAKLLLRDESPLQNIMDLCIEIQKREAKSGASVSESEGGL